MLVRLSCLLALLVAALMGCATVQPQVESWPAEDWQRTSPEAQGVDSRRLAGALRFIEEKDLPLHALVVVRHGVIVLEAYRFPFREDLLHDIASCTKSVTATALGALIQQGKLDGLDHPYVSFFKDREIPNLDETKRSVTLKHLLTMSSGLKNLEKEDLWKMVFADDRLAFALSLPSEVPPGESFNYTSANSHILSGVAQELSGQTTFELVQSQVFKPIGIARADWSAAPEGVTYGGGDLRLLPADLARIGLLYLHRGVWNGRRVLPEKFVEAAGSEHVDLPSDVPGVDYGYGLHWWTYGDGTFAAQGRGGQYLVVEPALDAVIVALSGAERKHGELFARMWLEHLRPALASPAPLRPSRAGRKELKAAIESLAAAPEPRPVPDTPVQAATLRGRSFLLHKNKVGLTGVGILPFGRDDEINVALDAGMGPVLLRAGLDGVPRVTESTGSEAERVLPFKLPVAAKGTWLADGTFELDLDLMGGIDRWLIQLRPEADGATLIGRERTFDIPGFEIRGRPE
jgi:CubicO group peptidase (beta-lactamase class C family)